MVFISRQTGSRCRVSSASAERNSGKITETGCRNVSWTQICNAGDTMDRFIYIHGFNSSAQSRSGQALAALLGRKVICLEYDYSRPFSECFASLRRQMLDAINEAQDRVCLMGSSLGGFYALELRHPSVIHVVAWNPVVFPAMQLAQFLGENTRFSDGRTWEFTRDVMLSYAQAPDPRPWRNETWAREERKARHIKENHLPFLDFGGGRGFSFCPGEGERTLETTPASLETARSPRRDIFLGNHDEVLDAGLARVFWQGAATLHDIDSGHQIMDYGHALDTLTQGKILERFDSWQNGALWASAFREAGSFDMAGILATGSRHEQVQGLLWLADVPFLELKGTEEGHSLIAAFFHARREHRMKRLLAGLTRLCGKHSYVFLRADGPMVRHQVAENKLMDAEYLLPLRERSLSGAVLTAFPDWKGTQTLWHGHGSHGSFTSAVMREHFSRLWDNFDDPIAEFEKTSSPSSEAGE